MSEFYSFHETFPCHAGFEECLSRLRAGVPDHRFCVGVGREQQNQIRPRRNCGQRADSYGPVVGRYLAVVNNDGRYVARLHITMRHIAMRCGWPGGDAGQSDGPTGFARCYPDHVPVGAGRNNGDYPGDAVPCTCRISDAGGKSNRENRRDTVSHVALAIWCPFLVCAHGRAIGHTADLVFWALRSCLAGC